MIQFGKLTFRECWEFRRLSEKAKMANEKDVECKCPFCDECCNNVWCVYAQEFKKALKAIEEFKDE